LVLHREKAGHPNLSLSSSEGSRREPSTDILFFSLPSPVKQLRSRLFLWRRETAERTYIWVVTTHGGKMAACFAYAVGP